MKQVLVMRKDLNMSPGKLAAQAAHASIEAFNVTPDNLRREWRNTGMTKIVLSSESEEKLISLYKQAIANYLPCSLICDEGRTEVKPGTITGIGIGPSYDSEIDKITGELLLY